MRFILVTSVLLAASLRFAFALRPASQSDIDAIEEQLADARNLDKNINAAKKKYSETAADVNSTKAKLLELDKAVEREIAKQRAARTKAIHMTILAYDLAPANPSGTSVMRWTKDRTITWLPVAGEGEDRRIQNIDGKFKWSKKPAEAYSGVTFPDGVTYIPESTFKNGVGFLASILFHERTHFEQYTTEGMGDVMNKAEREVNAYQKQLDNAKFFLDPEKDRDAIAEIKELLRVKKSEAKQENSLLGRIRRHLPSNGQPDKSELMVHTNAELADISGLVAQARSQADIARQDREEREERARAAEVRSARHDHDERLRNTLAEMAIRSCANPGILTQSELDALPDPYNKSFVDSPPGGLDSCAFMLYLRLGRGADADEIRQHSIPLRPIDVNSPPSLIPARPIPPSEAIALNPETPFSSVLPGLKNLAETACTSPGRASVDESLIRPSMPFSFAGERDDHAAANLSIGLGDCPRQLFNKLIEMIRSGKAAEITDIWIRDMAAVYSRPAFSRPVYIAPPRSGGDPCRDNGNRRCP